MGLIIDNFAGGGGASCGIEDALGRLDVAINHDPEALAMHRANHPDTQHYSQHIWQVDPRDVTQGQPVDVAWFSPDCTHHSKARKKGPKKRSARDLAWVVVHWAKLVRPTVIFLENVEEWVTWGPVDMDGHVIENKRGQTFKQWVRELRKLGYTKIEWRELRGCDYGTPTIRKRLFLVARCDGNPIVWPEPTHGPGLLPYRTAAECIDWSLPCHSIFLSPEEAKRVGVRRPLAEATMRRIARGVKRYVLDAAEPFIIPVTHHGDARVHSINEPVRTVTCAPRGELSLISPFFTPRYGERKGQEPRTRSVEEPMPTVVTTGNGASMVAAFLAQHNGGMVGHDARKPVSTIVQKRCTQAVVAAHLQRDFGNSVGQAVDRPAGTITAGGGGKAGLVASHLISLKGSDRRDGPMAAPSPTICAKGNHVGMVAAFLGKYYGTDHDPNIRDPLHTLTTKDRFQIVTVDIEGESYALVDIGMRMLSPRELFRAQGFPDDYIIDPIHNGKPLTKTAQVRMAGNSVCRQVAAALVSANCGATADERRVA